MEMDIYVQRICTRMFTEALFIIVKTGTTQICPLIEQINTCKLLYPSNGKTITNYD